MTAKQIVNLSISQMVLMASMTNLRFDDFNGFNDLNDLDDQLDCQSGTAVTF
jgi:hypothetical protein